MAAPSSVIEDLFRRADKNDDGCLSFDEFKEYLADGVLSEDEVCPCPVLVRRDAIACPKVRAQSRVSFLVPYSSKHYLRRLIRMAVEIWIQQKLPVRTIFLGGRGLIVNNSF